MGVRVDKRIGYGMRGFTPNAAFRKARFDQEPTYGDFVRWCEPRLDLIRSLVPDTPSENVRRIMLEVTLNGLLEDGKVNKSLSPHCEWADEFGLPDVLVFIPLGTHGWRRYNDDLDWAEETHFHGQRNRIEFLDREFNPFGFRKPPLTVAALAMFYGVPEVWPELKECLYVHWG